MATPAQERSAGGGAPASGGPAREVAARLLVRGAVGSPAFPPWIDRFARRLGLAGGVAAAGPEAVEVVVAGPPDLVDALELVCGLGPIEVDVESVERAPA